LAWLQELRKRKQRRVAVSVIFILVFGLILEN
jgi:hypothetical protein